jgi:EAL domain-containing protein (putative c-di-GMP-specific phosphodiesterase class I)
LRPRTETGRLLSGRGEPVDAAGEPPFLKLDRSATRQAPHDERCERITRAAIAVARSFGLRPLANGVESGEHARWLAANGAEELQGYYLGQPMTAPDFADWLRTARARDAIDT